MSSKYLQYDEQSGNYRYVETESWTEDQWKTWDGWKGEGMTSVRSLEHCENGIAFEWGLAGPGGASFVVFRLAGQTEAQLNEAVKEIRRKRDVVYLRRIRLKKEVS